MLSDPPKTCPSSVLGQFASPCLSSHFTARLAGGGRGRQRPRYSVDSDAQRTGSTLGKLAPSSLVSLATSPSTQAQLTRPASTPAMERIIRLSVGIVNKS